jgi:hypothetical protein
MRTCRVCGHPLGGAVCNLCGASNPLDIHWGPIAAILIIAAGLVVLLLTR